MRRLLSSAALLVTIYLVLLPVSGSTPDTAPGTGGSLLA